MRPWSPPLWESWSPFPAVIAFNLFQRRLKRHVGLCDSLAHAMLSEMHALPAERGGESETADEDEPEDS